MENDSVILDNGKTVLFREQAIIEGFDGTAAEIAVGNYIQGYATDPESIELEALRILVIILQSPGTAICVSYVDIRCRKPPFLLPETQN